MSLPPFRDMPTPYCSAHRGGGLIHPEGTLLGRKNCAVLGLRVIDGGDVRRTADGALIDNHDSTLDRTTNRSGDVDRTSVMEVTGPGELTCSDWFGGDWPDQPVTKIADVLDTLGGKVWLTFEAKSADAAQPLADAIAERGLADHVLVASFSEDHLTPARDIGCPVMLLRKDGDVGTGPLARGVEYVGAHAETLTVDQAKQLVADGYRVSVYDCNRHHLIDKFAGVGICGFISDDPLYTQGHIDGTYPHRLTSDPYGTYTYYHGHQAYNDSRQPGDRGVFNPKRWLKFDSQGGVHSVLMGWGCPLADPANYTIHLDTRLMDGAGGTGRWIGLVFGCPTDAGYERESGYGYEAFVRGDGQMELWRRDGGKPATLLKQVNTPARNNFEIVGYQVNVTADHITLTRLDTGDTFTVPDATYRGGYFHAMSDLSDGQSAEIRNVWIN